MTCRAADSLIEAAGGAVVAGGTVVVVVVVVVVDCTVVVGVGTVDGGSWVPGACGVEGGSCAVVFLPRLAWGAVCPDRSPRAGIVVGGTVEGVNGGGAGIVVVGGAGVTVVGAVTAGGTVTVAAGFSSFDCR